MRGRLLSPNETKCFLLDHAAPFNCVAVVRRDTPIEARALDPDFALPSVVLDRDERPRWSLAPEDREAGDVSIWHEADGSWLDAATLLLHERVGHKGHPNWRAILVPDGGGTILVFAVPHALCDWRSNHWVTEAILSGHAAGPLAPACEEALPPERFGRSDADRLVDGWWSAAATQKWSAHGLQRLSNVMPPASRTTVTRHRLTAAQTETLLSALDREGVHLNAIVAAVLRDEFGIERVAHAVDMTRFMAMDLPQGPGLAISHLYTDIPAAEHEPSPFAAARAVRASISAALHAGEPGDALLALPRALLFDETDVLSETASITITNAPGGRKTNGVNRATTMDFSMSSARGGGDVIALTFDGPCLALIVCAPTDRAANSRHLDITAIADRLAALS